ncbi:MAG: methyltransferase [Methanosarcinales archaeon]|jgi:putative methylase|nr:methyltransferase [Methanosarcinales archaeon]
MKQRKLEILLQKAHSFDKPKVHLEQYQTPAILAAELLHFAYMHNDLEGTVYDLGCGTGMLAIGAKLLGAEKVVGIEKDKDALKIAKKNAKMYGVDIEFYCCDITEIEGFADTVIMNPPFGAQSKGNDRPFLKVGLSISKTLYSIHNIGSYDFINKFIDPSFIENWYVTNFSIKRTFKFHKKDIEWIKVEIYRIICNMENEN